MERPGRRRVRALVGWASAALTVVLCFALHQQLSRPLAGRALNRMAWEATFVERGLPVPLGGPREGYWGARLGPSTPDPELGWRLPEFELPGLMRVDARGLQEAAPAAAGPTLLVLGGSVASGAYASRIERTYFARLASLLADARTPARVVVVAAGGWTSHNELAALRRFGPELAPAIVVLLDGLNDLTQEQVAPPEVRVERYLENVSACVELAAGWGGRVVFAPQPFLHGKRRLSPIEERIVEVSVDAAVLRLCYPRLVSGLRELAVGGVEWVDCTGVFDDEVATTFTDTWHFSDPGHELLARRLARGLAPLLAADQGR